MKKITFTFICIFLTYSINSQVYVSENFDSGTPSGWTDTYNITTTSPCSVQSVRDNLWSSSSTGNMTTSNFASASNGTDLTFSIDYKILNYSGLGATAQGWGTATLQYSTDNGANWIDVLVIDDSNHTTSTDCATASGTVAAANLPVGSDVKLRISNVWTTGDYYFYIDNFNASQVVSCSQVSSITVSNISTSSAELSWTAGDTETAWNVEYGVSGFTQGSGTTIATSSASASISGLTSNTSYDVYVQADCGGGDTGAWIGPVTVITNATCGDTLYDSGGATGDYANNELTVVTVSPTNVGDLVTLTFVSFNTEANYDKMWVYDGPDESGAVLLNGVSGTTIPSPITSSHATGSLTVKFDSDSSSVRSGYEIDVTCAAAPSCLSPSGLSVSSILDTSSSLSWTSNGTETAWNIEYGPSGFTQGTGTTIAVTTNPYTITGLTGNTAYDVYVQADCGVDGTSDWVGPTTFTTEPAPIVPNYTNDFSTYPGQFWTEGAGALTSGPSGATSLWGVDGFANNGSTGAAKVNIYSTDRDEWLISPMFDLSGGTYYLNLDAAATEWGSSTLDAIWGSDDFATLMASTDGGSTWTELYRWDANNNPGVSGAAMPQITLTGYSATSKFAFYGESSVSNEDIDFFIDNFQITTTSLGIEDNNVLQFKYFPNPVHDLLTIKAQNTVEDIKVFNMLGQLVLSQSPNTRDCTVDLSAMQTGAYFVQVTVGNTVETVRVLKN